MPANAEHPTSTDPRNRTWTLLIVSLGLFMVVLDNLVVNVALPSIHRQLGASIQALEWTVNAYVLSYAVFLLTGAALGDRFGRKRMFIVGIALFTLSSAAAALAPTSGTLIAARRRDLNAADAHAARRRISPRAPRRGSRRVVGNQRRGRGARPTGRRRGDAGSLMALDLLDQRPSRSGPRAASSRAARREPWPVPQAGPRRPRAGVDWPVRGRLWTGALTVAGLERS